MRLPRFIQAWFALDLLIALMPPIHWLFGVAEPALGVPSSLAYLWGASLFIAASVVAAYFADPAQDGER